MAGLKGLPYTPMAPCRVDRRDGGPMAGLKGLPYTARPLVASIGVTAVPWQA